jgi:hypothetical protein
MEWPLSLWIVLEEESEMLRRCRRLPADFSRLIDWTISRDDIVNMDGIINGLIERRQYLEQIPLSRLARLHLHALAHGKLSPAMQLISLLALLDELLDARNLYQPFWDIPDASWVQYVTTRRAPLDPPRRVNRI